jgi:hypothetical protein
VVVSGTPLDIQNAQRTCFLNLLLLLATPAFNTLEAC